jgi:hypothetical protein
LPRPTTPDYAFSITVSFCFYRRNFLKNTRRQSIYKLVVEAHNVYRILAGLFAVAFLVSAETGSQSSNTNGPANSAVASVSGSGPFSINGASLANGVPSWPILSGDQITSGNTPVLITLPDGTELELDPRSKVTIVVRNGIVEVIVSSGSCHQHDHGHGRHWCWEQPEKTSNHRCDGGRSFDEDNRCCPVP